MTSVLKWPSVREAKTTSRRGGSRDHTAGEPIFGIHEPIAEWYRDGSGVRGQWVES